MQFLVSLCFIQVHTAARISVSVLKEFFNLGGSNEDAADCFLGRMRTN